MGIFFKKVVLVSITRYVQMCQFHCFLYQPWILSELHVWNFSQFVFMHSVPLVFMVRCQQAKNHIGKKENFINESCVLNEGNQMDYCRGILTV